MPSPFTIPYKSQLSSQEMNHIVKMQPKTYDYLQAAKNNGIPLDLVRLLVKKNMLPKDKSGWRDIGRRLTDAQGNLLLVFLSLHTGMMVPELKKAIRENRLGTEAINAMAHMKGLVG